MFSPVKPRRTELPLRAAWTLTIASLLCPAAFLAFRERTPASILMADRLRRLASAERFVKDP